jgi:hypothetical protein
MHPKKARCGARCGPKSEIERGVLCLKKAAGGMPSDSVCKVARHHDFRQKVPEGRSPVDDIAVSNIGSLYLSACDRILKVSYSVL